MTYALLFLAGAVLCNCIPHLVAGLQGTPFPTPFAKPRGIGNSKPIVNFVWGFCNLAVSTFIMVRRLEFAGATFGLVALSVGFLVVGTYVSFHFSKVRRLRNDSVKAEFERRCSPAVQPLPKGSKRTTIDQ